MKTAKLIYIVTDKQPISPHALANGLVDSCNLPIAEDTITNLFCSPEEAVAPTPNLAYFMAKVIRIAKNSGVNESTLDIPGMQFHRFSSEAPERISGYVALVLKKQ